MNKTVNINLAGIFFHIDEDAYAKLSRYLKAIQNSFTDSQGRSEIIADIEARIAELFTERIENNKQVVGVSLLDEVIAIMGQPEDYLVDDEIFEDEKTKKRSVKKLYRDTDSSYVGGVSAGLGHYLGIDAIWVRLLWVILALSSFGTFVFIYLVMWALVPEAKSTAEKLTMTGNPVNISNIERKIKDGFDIVSEKVKQVDFEKQGNRLKSASQRFFEILSSVLLFILKAFSKVIGIIFIIIGIGTIMALAVMLIAVIFTDNNMPGIEIVDAANAANIPIWLMSILTFFAVSIPFFFIFYLGLKILVKNLKSIGYIAKFTLLGVWLLAIIGLVITGVKQASEHAFDAKVNTRQQLNIKANDTLIIRTNEDTDYYLNTHRRGYHFVENGTTIISSNIRLIVKSTNDDVASIRIEKEASGSNYEISQKRAQNIEYNFTINGNELILDPYLSTSISNKLSEQEVTVILYLPENTILYQDDNVHFRTYSYDYDNLINRNSKEHFIRILDNDTECIDCPIKEEESTSINIKSSGLNISSDEEKTNINITDEDDNGIKISIDN